MSLNVLKSIRTPLSFLASPYRTMATSTANSYRLAVCQVMSGTDKAKNLEETKKYIDEAAMNKSKIVVLPECFNGPYNTASFPAYAEEIPSSSDQFDPVEHVSSYMLSNAAKEHQIYLIGGSIPERDKDGNIYNTCVVYGPDGNIVAKHRKMHLFDIDIPGRITFKESDTLTPGKDLNYFDTPWGRVGLGICYDIRFPVLSMLLREAGAHLLVYPGAFNMTTGPAHWEILLRARAVDNQCYVAGASIARNPESDYTAWGHSTIVSPWGDVVATTDEHPGILYTEIRTNRVEEIREHIPISKQARKDLYSVEWNASEKK